MCRELNPKNGIVMLFIIWKDYYSVYFPNPNGTFITAPEPVAESSGGIFATTLDGKAYVISVKN